MYNSQSLVMKIFNKVSKSIGELYIEATKYQTHTEVIFYKFLVQIHESFLKLDCTIFRLP